MAWHLRRWDGQAWLPGERREERLRCHAGALRDLFKVLLWTFEPRSVQAFVVQLPAIRRNLLSAGRASVTFEPAHVVSLDEAISVSDCLSAAASASRHVSGASVGSVIHPPSPVQPGCRLREQPGGQVTQAVIQTPVRIAARGQNGEQAFNTSELLLPKFMFEF
jgi:hypothetical protein